LIKEVCFLGIDELGRMLLEFEERAKFDHLDVEKLYADSSKRIRTKKSGEIQPRRNPDTILSKTTRKRNESYVAYEPTKRGILPKAGG
jgi:hypothetical protein